MKNIKKKGYKKQKDFLTQEQQNVFRQAFQIFDTDHSNNIDFFQFSDLMKALGFKYSSQKIKQIMEEVNKDHSGLIGVDQFINFMKKHIIDQNNMRFQIEKVFNYFDDDKSGFIDFRKLKTVVQQCCSNVNDQIVTKMIKAGDTDLDGKVSKYEFMRIMKKMKLI